MNRSILALVASTVVATGAMAVSNPAHAGTDYKTFNTMLCVPNGTAASNDLTYSYLGVLNTSTTESRVVICPLVKDADNHITDAAPASLTVGYVTAASKSGSVNCNIYVGFYQPGGGQYYSASSPVVERPANTYTEFSLDIRTDPSNFLPVESLVCAISPRTRLSRIIMNETGVTNTP